MEKINSQENLPNETNISAAVEQLFSGESNDAKEILAEIESLRQIISPYHEQVVDRKTYDFIEEIAKKIHILESRLTVVDTLKYHLDSR
jgi:hypothetical protein